MRRALLSIFLVLAVTVMLCQGVRSVICSTGDPVLEGVHTGALYVNSGATPTGVSLFAVDPIGGVSVPTPTLSDHAAT